VVCCAREFWRLKSRPEKGQPWALRGGVDGCGCVMAGCKCYCVSSSIKKLTVTTTCRHIQGPCKFTDLKPNFHRQSRNGAVISFFRVHLMVI
jgi:hypothetical protein